MRQYEDNEEKMYILRAKQGDQTAYEYLVKKYQRNIYSLCLGMTGAHQAADDLSQDTFIKAFFTLAKFKENRRFYPWIRRIAVNKTLNYLKRRKREKSLGEAGERHMENPSNPHSPPDKLVKKKMREKFQEAFHSLPPDQKAIFILRVYEDMSYEAISDALKIPPGTVMSRLNRARQKLKSLMADYI